MKQLFYINPGEPAESSQSILLLEAGETHLYFGILSQATRQLQALGYYSVDPDEDLSAAVFNHHPELNASYYQVLISYHFSRSLLVPDKFYAYEQAQDLLNGIYGRQVGNVLIAESLPAYDMHNVYEVPASLHDWASRHFSGAKCWHASSVALKTIPRDLNGPRFYIDFKTEGFSLLFANNGQLQLAQVFSYSNPEDVLYYLLKICREFSVSQQDLVIRIGGLIEEDSSLYGELHKYFMNLEFSGIPDEIRVHESFNEYPLHLFTSIYNLALCVS